MQFIDWRFAADLDAATHRASGTTIRFTAAERALLCALVAQPNRVCDRNGLLDAVSGQGSDVSDRSVDVLIRQLRNKLGDSARRPRYIETRYGRGYAWIAVAARTAQPSEGALVVVGPANGLQFAASGRQDGLDFARHLRRTLDARTAPEERVCLDLDCPPPRRFEGEPPRFAVVLNFHAHGDLLDCALVLRGFASGRVHRIMRCRVRGPNGPDGAQPCDISAVAERFVDDIWRAMNYSATSDPAPDDEPLSVRLHRAAAFFAGERHSWQEAEKRLRRHLGEQPDDHASRIQLATTLHSKYVISGVELLENPNPDPRPADEAAIESLVTTALPHVQHNDIFLLAAAKLLYFVHPSHRRFALGMAEDALARTTAFASAFAVVGQLWAWEGRIDEAVALYDQGLDLTERGSHFDLYIRILRCQALTAAGRWADVAAEAGAMYRIAPATRLEMALFYEADEGIDLAPEIARLLAGMTEARSRAILRFTHYLAARLFRRAAHRENTMRRPTRLLTARFGPRCVPDEWRTDSAGSGAAASLAVAPDAPSRRAPDGVRGDMDGDGDAVSGVA